MNFGHVEELGVEIAWERTPSQEAPAQRLSCFTAGTLVATRDGLRPIEAIRRGEQVWSCDLVKQLWRLCRVAEPYSIHYKGTLVLVTAAGETTEATYQHPYSVVRGAGLADRPRPEHLAEVPSDARVPGRWVDSSDLRVGDEVLLRDGRIVPVERLGHRLFEGAVYNMEVEDLHCYAVGGSSVLVHNNNGSGTGMPRKGAEIGRGAEGVVYENLDQPGTVVKEFNQGGTSPVQAENEFQNLERAWAIRPDNVVEAQAPLDPRQGFLVKERVLPSSTPPDPLQKAQILRDFQNIQDAASNLMWGTTANNPTPRWILIE